MDNIAKQPQIVVRPAEPEDQPRAKAVRWSVGWEDPPRRHRQWAEADPDWQASRYFREIVAEVDGVIAARVGLEAYRQPFAHLVDLSVRPAYQRRGLGEMLTRACQIEAARRGFSALFLQTELDNGPAHHLYTKQGFVPTAHGNMLRMVNLFDYPLIEGFRRAHPLNQYWCTAAQDAPRAWDMEWHAYITEDYLRLRLEGGASHSDSEGLGPALTALDWRIGQGARGLKAQMTPEASYDLEPGHHVALDLTIENTGKRMEAGICQMILPPNVQVSSPATNVEQTFAWQAAPGERIVQSLVLEIETIFDTSPLWYLNYRSLPVCMEIFWEGHRSLLSVSLPMAAPPAA